MLSGLLRALTSLAPYAIRLYGEGSGLSDRGELGGGESDTMRDGQAERRESGPNSFQGIWG